MTIGIWGDSITYGEGDIEALGWVGRFRKSRPEETEVYNRGVCGNTTDDLLKRFPIEADSIRPDVIVFAIGINDSKYPKDQSESKVPLSQYKENMRKILEMARVHTDRIYIVGATKTDDEFARNSGTRFVNDTIQIYNTFLKELCKTEALTFIDVFGVLDSTADLNDGLHPNTQGYEKLFKTINKTL